MDPPAIREWFVFPGNLLKEPDIVHPLPVSLPCTVPSVFHILIFGHKIKHDFSTVTPPIQDFI